MAVYPSPPVSAIEVFNPFTCNVITSKVGFMSVTFLFDFYVLSFLFLCYPIIASFMLNRYHSVYYFNSPAISFTVFFVIFLVVLLMIIPKILILNLEQSR